MIEYIIDKLRVSFEDLDAAAKQAYAELGADASTLALQERCVALLQDRAALQTPSSSMTAASEDEAQVAKLQAEVEMLRRPSAAEAKLAHFTGWLDSFEAATRELPAGVQDLGKGANVYNWRIWFVREARAALRSAP